MAKTQTIVLRNTEAEFDSYQNALANVNAALSEEVFNYLNFTGLSVYDSDNPTPKLENVFSWDNETKEISITRKWNDEDALNNFLTLPTYESSKASVEAAGWTFVENTITDPAV